MLSSATGYDSRIIFYEGAAQKWSMGQDGSDAANPLLWDSGSNLVGANTKWN